MKHVCTLPSETAQALDLFLFVYGRLEHGEEGSVTAEQYNRAMRAWDINIQTLSPVEYSTFLEHYWQNKTKAPSING